MVHSTLRTLPKVIIVSFSGVALAAIALYAAFHALRLGYCIGPKCEVKRSGDSAHPANSNFSAESCVANSLILQRGNTRSIRDKILLVGSEGSIAEYILPLMHLSKYDPSLSDSSFSRQGLSAVKYGYPIPIPNSQIRYRLFELGLADAIVLAPQKIPIPINPAYVKYRFRLQPFKRRIQLPNIPTGTGISEDSEVVQEYITRNPNLFWRVFLPMPVVKLSSHKFQARFLPILSVAWLGLQLKGYYWLLSLILCGFLLSLNRFVYSRLLVTRQVYLAAFLLIFSLSLLCSATIDAGVGGLLSEFPITVPVLPIFVFSCITLGPRTTRGVPSSKYRLSVIVISTLIALEAISRGFLLSDSPASSLRPLEIQASSSIFLMTSIVISTSFQSSSIRFDRHYSFYLNIVSFFLSFFSFVCFRGAASASCLAINIITLFLLSFLPLMSAYGSFVSVLPLALVVLSLSLVLDLRFVFLKYIVSPFVTNDLGNGRLTLLQNWITDYGHEPLRVFGAQPTVPNDLFAHNLIIDSMIKDGLVPASALLLFGFTAFVFLLRDLFQDFNKYTVLSLSLYILMALPALVQPVQFAHAFSFLISISTVAILTSMSLESPHSGFPSLDRS